MRALFLGCHCDDLELGCGATLNKRKDNWDIFCVTFSTYGICNGVKKKVKKYSQKAISSLGITNSQYFNFPPNEFYKYRQKVWKKLYKLQHLIQPDMVFVTEPDNQQDHKTLYEETLRNFRKSSIFSYKVSVRNSPIHNYNYYEKLDKKNIQAKKIAINFYPKDYQKYIYFRSENIEACLRFNGIYIEEEFAEVFNVVKLIV